MKKEKVLELLESKKIDYLKLGTAIFEKKDKLLCLTFLYAENNKELIDREKEKINKLIEEYVNLKDIKINIKYQKAFLDEDRTKLIIKEFLKKHPEVRLSVSTTTRNPRPGEVHGVHYFFVSKDDFLKMVENEEFLEHAEFGGNFYGTGKSFVADNLANGNDVLLEIDTAGVKQIFAKMPDCSCNVTLFVI